MYRFYTLEQFQCIVFSVFASAFKLSGGITPTKLHCRCARVGGKDISLQIRRNPIKITTDQVTLRHVATAPDSLRLFTSTHNNSRYLTIDYDSVGRWYLAFGSLC